MSEYVLDVDFRALYGWVLSKDGKRVASNDVHPHLEASLYKTVIRALLEEEGEFSFEITPLLKKRMGTETLEGIVELAKRNIH